MSSAGDSDIKVGGKSMLISQVNSKMLDTHSEYTTSGMFSDKDHVESHQSLTETLAESSITAGGKNVLINKGEQVLQGARLEGESGVFLKGSKTSLLAARLRNMQSDYEYHEDTFTNSTDADGHDNITHEHSKIISSGEITIDSDTIEADYTRKFKEKGSGIFSDFGNTFGGLDNSSPLDVTKPAWAKQVEASGKTIKWNPLEDSSKSWSVHQEVLNQEFTALVSLAAAIGTMGAGGFGVFAAGGAAAGGATAGTAAAVTNASMMSTIGTAMGQSALVGLASKGSVSLINNGVDLGKVAGDLTSKESLKGLGLNMVTAGLTAGIGHGMELGSIEPGMDMAGRAKILAQQAIISGAVRTGLAGASGENVGQAWKDEALSMGLALGQSKIGDIAQDNGLKSGSLGKVAMHSAAGSLYSLASGSNALSGAIGGATSELVAGVMESGKGTSGPPLTKEEQHDLNNKIKATT